MLWIFLTQRSLENMRFISYIAPQANQWAPCVGVVLPGGSQFIDLVQVAQRDGGTFPWTTDVIEITATGEPAFEAIRKWIAWAKRDKTAPYIRNLNDVQLLSPVPLPTSLRDCMCFEQHIIQSARTAIKWKFPPAAFLCLLYTSPSPRDATLSRMPSSA